MDVLFTGDAEHTGDAFVFEALDEELSGSASSFRHGTDGSESRRALKAAG
jgi:hypothetical protein